MCCGGSLINWFPVGMKGNFGNDGAKMVADELVLTGGYTELRLVGIPSCLNGK